MGDIALRGNKLTKGPHGHGPKPFLNRPGQAQGTHGGKATGGRVGKFGGGRTNLLEELGRVEAEPSNRNRRAEISRVHSELNKGYATGGRVGLKKGGKPWGTGPKPGTHDYLMQQLHKPRKGKAIGGVLKHAIKKLRPKGPKKPKSRDSETHGKDVRTMAAEGGRIGLKKGGSDKNWIQKAVNPKHKGFCTPMTKKTCTPRRKALARTFKKKAKTGW